MADATGKELAPLMAKAEVGLPPDVQEAVVACVVLPHKTLVVGNLLMRAEQREVPLLF